LIGFYDTQYLDRNAPDMRGRLHTNEKGEYGYRAVVPVAYPIPGDGPVGELLLKLERHNMVRTHVGRGSGRRLAAPTHVINRFTSVQIIFIS
jgi:protocatechuate 3,4-dioxygenase beta subunit